MLTEERTPFRRLLLLIGSFGPLGHAPASGTVTVALIGVPLYWLFSTYLGLPPAAYLALVAALTLFAVWLHDVGDRILRKKDSSTLVWDEIVGFLIGVAFVPFSWPIVIIAFFLERAIDIAKVPPARWIEDRWPGGWGVVGDDVVAGIYTCLLLHLLTWCFPGLQGLPG